MRLGTSPATVNSAYRTLARRGLAVAEGRRGTRVAPRPALRTPRGAPSPAVADPGLRDLSAGLPDPALLPSVSAALRQIDAGAALRISGEESVHPRLLRLARRSFTADGVSADSIAVVSGALDGLERVLDAHLRPGDRVAIEDPAYPPTRDLLFALGLTAVPVQVDENGLLPDRLASALANGIAALVTVSRAQNPLGAALDAQRQRDLQQLLAARPDVLIVEDDHAGIVAGADFRCPISSASERWAVIRSTSKTLHPYLRVALLSGDETTIARIEGHQALGPRWVSHILQATVAELLADPATRTAGEHAREQYARRRRALIGALEARGIQAHGRSGLNVWVPVREEAPVVRALLDAGWLVLAGERFRIRTPPAVRVTIATLGEDEAEQIARVIAAAEQSGRPRRGY